MGEGAKHGPTFNGGYYSAGGGGAPIPSPTAVYVLPQRRRRIPCFLKFLIHFIIGLVVIVGIAALVIWLVVHPTKPKFYVDGIDFSNSTSSGSNIALDMSVRNANKKMGIYYDTFYATTFYRGQSIAFTELQEFYQGHKNTTVLHPAFVSTVSFSSFNAVDVADIQVQLRSRVRFKVGKLKTRRYKLKVKCRFSAPLNETTATTFTRKKCKVDVDR